MSTLIRTHANLEEMIVRLINRMIIISAILYIPLANTHFSLINLVIRQRNCSSLKDSVQICVSYIYAGVYIWWLQLL